MTYQPRFIQCAAVYFQDDLSHSCQPVNVHTGHVVGGKRHKDCYDTARKVHPGSLIFSHTEGFLTTDNFFVDRKKAYTIALEAGQIHNKIIKLLFSEDLY